MLRKRLTFSESDLLLFHYYFEINPYPSLEIIHILSYKINVTPRQVKVWFQNQRALKNKQIKRFDKFSKPYKNDFKLPPILEKTTKKVDDEILPGILLIFPEFFQQVIINPIS